jgi:hypothetical protein
VTARTVRTGLVGAERDLQLSVIDFAARTLTREVEFAEESTHRVGRTLLDAGPGDADGRVALARDAAARAASLLHVAVYSPAGERVDTIYRRSAGARVTLPAGLYCGLDGAALAATTTEPLVVDRRRAHALRCAVDAGGDGAVEWPLAADPPPPPPVETPAVVAPVVIAPAPVVAPDRWYHRRSLRLEGGAAYMLSEYQRNADRGAYLGNAPALSWGGGARGGFQLARPDGGDARSGAGARARRRALVPARGRSLRDTSLGTA